MTEMLEVIAIDVWHNKMPSESTKDLLKRRAVRKLRHKNYMRYMFTHNWYPNAYSFYNDGIRTLWIYPEDYQQFPDLSQ